MKQSQCEYCGGNPQSDNGECRSCGAPVRVPVKAQAPPTLIVPRGARAVDHGDYIEFDANEWLY